MNNLSDEHYIACTRDSRPAWHPVPGGPCDIVDVGAGLGELPVGTAPDLPDLRPAPGQAYDLAARPRTLAEPCPNCGFNFPVAKETANSAAVFKDII